MTPYCEWCDDTGEFCPNKATRAFIYTSHKEQVNQKFVWYLREDHSSSYDDEIC